MGDLKYPLFFNKSPMPFLVGKVILDDQSKPYDFEILEVNDAFEKLLKMKSADIVGIRISQRTDFSNNILNNWLDMYRNAFNSQKTLERDIFATSINKWLRIRVFPLQNHEYGCIFSDVLLEHQQEQTIENCEKLNRELAEKTEELERFFSVNLDLLCIADLDGNFIKVNKSWETILGYSTTELENSKFLQYVHPDDMEATLAFMSRLGEQEDVVNFVNRYRCRDGSYRYIEWRSHPYGDIVYAAARDITEPIMSNQALKVSEEKYRLIAENTSDVIWVLNMNTQKFVYISPSILQLSGYTVEEAMAQSVAETMTPEFYAIVMEESKTTLKEFLKHPEISKRYVHEIQQPCKNGDIIWVEITSRYYLTAQNEVELVGTSRNIEDRKRAEHEILFLSYRDQLTGLYNRRFFEEEIKRLDTPRNLPISIIVGDLNKLKYINDTFGHADGDEYIVKAARVIKSSCRADDIVSRWGGDEFLVLLPRTDQSEVQKIIDRIQANCMAAQVDQISVSIALGVGIKTIVQENIYDAMRAADDEMYKTKTLMKNGTK